MSHFSFDYGQRRNTIRVFLSLTLVVLIGLCACAVYFGQHSITVPSSRLIADARVALARQQFDLAEGLAGQVDQRDTNWGVARLLAGEAATRDRRTEQALAYYNDIPRDGSPVGVLASLSAAELYRELGRLSDAQAGYQYCLQHQPDNADSHERLAFLYGVAGRKWESFPHFFYLVVHNKYTLQSLAILGDLDRPVEQEGYLERCLDLAPNDILVQLAQGADALYNGHADEARRILQSVVKRDPAMVAAQAMLGELLVDADDAAFFAWQSGLSKDAEAYPDTWYVRGLRARRQGNLRVAARCFWEAMRLAPTHRRGIYQLGQVLVALGESSGPQFSERSNQLFALTQALDNTLKSKGQSEDSIRKVTSLCEACGRLWETWAWARTAAQLFPDAEWPDEIITRMELQLDERTPATIDSANLALKFDLSAFPDHRELTNGTKVDTKHIKDSTKTTAIHFELNDVGINFKYVNGSDPLTEPIPQSDQNSDVKVRIRTQNRARMFEQNGGGVGVIDYDNDSWPDLCFSQGTTWKHGSKLPELKDAPQDRMFRNRSGQEFLDVTAQSRLLDLGYGQGCTVGDFDNDGFPDLYIANIGQNRLHHNNGDGTFSDVTDLAGIRGDDWTASCVMVDLNADQFPDLFDVTYLTGPDVYEAICNGHACSPKGFDGIPDRLRINRGDGRFELVPDATPSVNSKGLGVVAFDLHERGRPALYIANDQVPDYLLRNRPSTDRFNLQLSDEGFQCGLAFNEDGLAMASMGIAADDANGDGRLDFFVTNFKDESDILYLQDSPGLFIDATNMAGLRAPSLPFVGWGTQFIDADLNGEMDLVVANGHVDDYRAEGGDYHMRPQFLQNVGQGRFVERTADEVGEFFGRKFLGRGLARLDWNADGRMDFVVSNIGDLASLVTNQSTSAGHFLNVRLHATATARDAIGTVVEIAAGDRRWTKQLVAGDGYMASNERMLQFGLGEKLTVAEVTIRWPSGSTTTLRDVPVDVSIELTEGSKWGTLWTGREPQSLSIEPTLKIASQ